MSDPKAAIAELNEEFAFFDDWTDRYQYIIDMGKQLPAFPADKQDDAHKFHGCQSQVWFDYAWDGDRLMLQGTSDATIVKGLIALLFRVYNGQTAEDILATDPELLDTLGLKAHLSANRATGLVGMIQKIRSIAAESGH
ncbi:Fe-S cluster assembly protein SufE [Halothiobacillus diazotrophicus]|uniref:Fe-S cluster assembly protein SufE n=1 Tax=Halothiobacillus diazotrophicus TaxID=1860122 RepID=A0A191ZEN1_9GAMM|nr:SufE family protein [Halothiobacillus diazotrophicus]ANJ66322.1 Fe-S cluster assembly protein SufE [Halothiobacillus diazotrophicus]